jgi:hypothetical protein
MSRLAVLQNRISILRRRSILICLNIFHVLQLERASSLLRDLSNNVRPGSWRSSLVTETRSRHESAVNKAGLSRKSDPPIRRVFPPPLWHFSIAQSTLSTRGLINDGSLDE